MMNNRLARQRRLEAAKAALEQNTKSTTSTADLNPGGSGFEASIRHSRQTTNNEVRAPQQNRVLA